MNTHSSGASKSQHVRVRNNSQHPIKIYVEPWGDVLQMPSSTLYQIAAEGPAGDCMEVQFNRDGLTIYGWAGAVLSIYENGILVKDYPIPPPRTPTL